LIVAKQRVLAGQPAQHLLATVPHRRALGHARRFSRHLRHARMSTSRHRQPGRYPQAAVIHRPCCPRTGAAISPPGGLAAAGPQLSCPGRAGRYSPAAGVPACISASAAGFTAAGKITGAIAPTHSKIFWWGEGGIAHLGFVIVGDLGATLVAAVAVFAGTNVDDLIVLTVLFLSARAIGRPKPWQIWVGQYAGIGVLVAVSAAAALGLTIVPDRWVGLLGLVPFLLGVKGLVAAVRARHDDEPPAPTSATGPLSVAGITIANGADNISVYTPLFRTIGLAGSLITVAVFTLGIAAWCLAGFWLGSHRKIIDVVRRFGHWIVPAVFMLIGAVIVIESGVLNE
jgi:cadmium resistance protein CadD (predicted permease)